MQQKQIPESPPLRRYDAGWTFEALLDRDFDGRFELDEEGRLHEVSGDFIDVLDIALQLRNELFKYIFPLLLGYVFLEAPVILDTPRRRPTVIPDVSFVSRSHKNRIVREGGIEGNPDIAIEVLSAGNVRRKWIEKLNSKYRLYKQPELWLIYPKTRTIRVLCYKEGAPGVILPRIGLLLDYEERPARPDGQPDSLALPGLQLDLEAVFYDQLAN